MPPDEKNLTEQQQQHLAMPITKDDLEIALRHMKKGTSPGVDGLTVEFYQ